MKKRYKILCLLLCGISVFAIFGGCKDKKEEKAFLQPKVISAAEKYRLDQPIEKYRDDVYISLAKNEYESAQIVVTPEKNVNALSVTVSEFRCGDSVIPASDINVYWEHYVYVFPSDTPNADAGYIGGYYPDALVPMELKKNADGETRVKQGQNQGIFVTFKTQKDTAAGEYTGSVILDADGHKETVNATVRVYDFALSDETHMKSSFAVWDYAGDDSPNYNFKQYLSTDPEIGENYYEFFLDYRICPRDIPNEFMYSREDRVKKFIEYVSRNDVAALSLPYEIVFVNRTIPMFDEEYMRYTLAEVAKACLNNPAITDKIFAYFTYIDEPKADNYTSVKMSNQKFVALLKEVADKYLTGEPSIYDEFLDIELVNTADYDAGKLEANLVNTQDSVGIDTWCPIYDVFDSESHRNELAARQEYGDGLWWYGAVDPKNPFPNLHIPDSLVPMRTLMWMQTEYGIEGQLYWVVNNYVDLDTAYRDTWNDPLGYVRAAGDGQLAYPGRRYGLNGPIPSMRLENFRAGAEDYEYLYKLKELFEAKKPKYIGYDFNDYVANLYKQMYIGMIAKPDAALLESVRDELAHLIVLAEKGIFADVSVNPTNSVATVNIYSENEISDITVNGKAAAKISDGYYTQNIILSNKTQYAEISLKTDGVSYGVKRFSGGVYASYADFGANGISSAISVTDFSRFDEIDDVKAETVEFGNGKAMKVTCASTGGESLSYLPRVTVANAGGLDFSEAEKFVADIYNDDEKTAHVSITVIDSEGNSLPLTTVEIKPYTTRKVDVLFYGPTIGGVDLKSIKEIRFTMDTVTEEGNESVLYFGNIYITERSAV